VLRERLVPKVHKVSKEVKELKVAVNQQFMDHIGFYGLQILLVLVLQGLHQLIVTQQ
jgi:hypothetical protein